MVTVWALPGLVLTSLLPGWLLVRALWPEARVRDPMSFLRTLVLSIAFSIAITIVVASTLGFLPHGETGLFRPLWIGAALVAATVGLASWALRRGAFPRLARRPTRELTPTEAETTLVAVHR